MKISIICSDINHPIWPWLKEWKNKQGLHHDVELLNSKKELTEGDILFLISCHEVISEKERTKYSKVLVIHASALPKGRGWSPLVWQIIEGKNSIAVTLLEAEDKVDSGDIWGQTWLEFEGHELLDEINSALFKAELKLMDYALENFGSIKPTHQDSRQESIYRKRVPEDSRIDPNKSIAEQFDLLRICDPKRYPAFFDFRGCRYAIQLNKIKKQS
jgi:methionyl-tRNA formyltransferase